MNDFWNDPPDEDEEAERFDEEYIDEEAIEEERLIAADEEYIDEEAIDEEEEETNPDKLCADCGCELSKEELDAGREMCFDCYVLHQG